MVYYLASMGTGIERYAETEMDYLDVPGEEVNKRIEYADPSQMPENAYAPNVVRREQGFWLKPETLPKKILWANGSLPLPDILPGFVVCSRFKDLVEQFEPSVHQFVPVDIYKSRTSEPAATYYYFIVGQRLDSVDREHTTFKWKAPADNPSDGRWSDRQLDTNTFKVIRMPDAKLVYSNERIAGHHIWHDPHVTAFNNGLCSDAFAEVAVAANFSGLSATSRDSV